MAVRSPFTWLEATVREIVVVSLFLCALIATGTAGYILIEGWNWMDGLYFTFITLTTIGFGEIHELSTTGRFFTILIAFFGIGAVAYIAGRSAQVLLVGRSLRESHMKRQIGRMKNHYIICGYGRVGKRIAKDLIRAEETFVVIDRAGDEIELLREEGIPFVEGDAEDERTLNAAALRSAKGLILATPEDSTNVFVSLTAREIRKDLFILARANSRINARKLLHAGANKAIAPDEIGARRMAQVILRPHVDRFMDEIFQAESLDRAMDEVTIREDAGIIGKSLAQSNFRQQFDLIVIAVIDGATRKMRFNPNARDAIRAQDILIVLGHSEVIRRLRELHGTPVTSHS